MELFKARKSFGKCIFCTQIGMSGVLILAKEKWNFNLQLFVSARWFPARLCVLLVVNFSNIRIISMRRNTCAASFCTDLWLLTLAIPSQTVGFFTSQERWRRRRSDMCSILSLSKSRRPIGLGYPQVASGSHPVSKKNNSTLMLEYMKCQQII